MKKLSLLFLLCAVACQVRAQANQYLIELIDKTGSAFSIDRPEEFLSKRAIDRRKAFNIPIKENDLPVSRVYLDSIRSAGDVKILSTSKWLNMVSIETDDVTALRKISSFSFVKNTGISKRIADTGLTQAKFTKPIDASSGVQKMIGSSGILSYGGSDDQIKMHRGEYLHERGFRGSGVVISVIDAGFYRYKNLPAFDSIRYHNRILDTWDFVTNRADMNDEHEHGMHCLSIIAANMPGQMVGSAPDAYFLLYRSENVDAEYRGEEHNWIAAAERSDSAGADIISTSLGYNTFDNPLFDYTYADMNGRTTLITRGAEIAASKGMLLVTAAGNEGNKLWRYVTSPGDAENSLTVGAIDIDGNPATFTSYGPTPDGRVKPDVVSMGAKTFLQNSAGGFSKGYGTSYATPNLAGLIACLWQAFPEFSAEEIIKVVRRSGDRYPNADARLGYGIPNFEKAFQTLSELRIQKEAAKILDEADIAVFPNPLKNNASLVLRVNEGGQTLIRWYNALGKMVYVQTQNIQSQTINIISLTRNGLPPGVYVLTLDVAGKRYKTRVVLD